MRRYPSSKVRSSGCALLEQSEQLPHVQGFCKSTLCLERKDTLSEAVFQQLILLPQVPLMISSITKVVILKLVDPFLIPPSWVLPQPSQIRCEQLLASWPDGPPCQLSDVTHQSSIFTANLC
ncbi:hypothetical protein MG293_001443 [Ovis ammon polii]|uniref:Uncharacterized protein n=1 Tax=Ovis ammon polii TaxID=230172 RepID=A0AAD4UMJ0_OVIAM|nr:hypothetical protein MG293_001443 [Ovis ammon polii]